MTKTHTRSPLAMTAIAAVLALSATPTLAQEAVTPVTPPVAAEPVPVTVAPAPAPQPVIVSQPVIQQAPAAPVVVAEPDTALVATAAAPAARTTSRAARSAPARVAAPAAVSAAPAISTLPEPIPAEVAEPAIAAVPVTAPAAEAQPAAEPADPIPSDALMLGGLLAALGLGGAYALTRRRRRVADETVEFERPVVKQITPVAPSASPAPVAFKPLVADPVAFAAPTPERRIERFAMPAGPVPHGTERRELIERMVTSPADTANPFKTRKARRRRAEIILHEREDQLQQQARQPYDWRQHETATPEVKPVRDPALV